MGFGSIVIVLGAFHHYTHTLWALIYSILIQSITLVESHANGISYYSNYMLVINTGILLFTSIHLCFAHLQYVNLMPFLVTRLQPEASFSLTNIIP